MARDLARLVVRLEAQTSRYIRELDRANAKLGSFEKQTKRALSSIDTAFKRVLTGAAVLALARSVGNLSDEYTQLQNSLRVAGLQGRALESVQGRLFAAANKNGVEIGSLAQLYRRSSIAARELGADQSQLLKFVDGVSAALRVQGGSTASASGALLQLSQALGAGIVRAEEFNSILEGALPIAQATANGIDRFGGSVSRLREAIKKGQVTSREFFDGFLRGSADLEAQAAKTSKTVAQAFTVLRNNLVRVVGGLAESSGITKGFASAVETLANSLEGVARALGVVVVAAGALTATLAVERFFKALAAGRAVIVQAAAAERASAAAAVEAAEATVAQTSATLAATRAEQAKAVVLVGSAAATDTAAVAAVVAARAEHARAAAILATTRAEAAKAAVVAGAVVDEGLRLGIARTLVTLEAQELAAKQALTAAEARLAAATAATNTAMFARAAAAKQLAALEAELAAAQTGLAAATVRANAAATASTGALGLAVQKLGAPVRAFFALIARHPVGALVTAIAAAVAALVIFADKIKTSRDGVITLQDTAVAAWRIIAEGLEPLAKAIEATFGKIVAFVTDNFATMRELGATVFAPFIAAAEGAEVAVKKAARFIPALQILLKLGENVTGGLAATGDVVEAGFDAVQARARRIARIRSFVPGARQRSRGAPAASIEPPSDPAALKKIQELEAALRQQVATFQKGEVATIRYRIAQGDLADEFKKAGAAADPYRSKLVQLTQEHETQKLEEFAKQLEQEVAAYGLSGAAAVEYRLKLGDLSKAYAEAIAAGGEFARRAQAAADKAKAAAADLEGKQVAKTLAGIRAELAELRGETEAAFVIRFEAEQADFRKQLKDRGDTAGQEAVNELERQGRAVAKFNELGAESARVNAQLAEQETRIRNSQEVGALTEFDAAAKISAARETAAAQLETILQKQKAIATESGNPELVRNVEAATTAYEELKSQVNLVGLAIQSAFEEALEGPLVDFLTGVQSAEDAFKSFVRTIEREIAQFVARDLIRRMFGDLFKDLNAGSFGGGGGGGGINWAGVAGFVAGLFGGAAASGPALAGSAASGAFTLGAQPVMLAAEGGRFSPGVPTVVGERGPELVVPRNADVVVPNHDLRGMMREPRAVQVVNNFSLAPVGGQVERRTLSQLAAATARSVADASRRNN